MNDMIMRQLDDRIVEIHQMMARANGPGDITPPPKRIKGEREAIARAILWLATRLAPLTPESHTA